MQSRRDIPSSVLCDDESSQRWIQSDWCSEYPHQHVRQGSLGGQCVCGALVAQPEYEEVYLKAYESVAEARLSIGNYFRFYNLERKHQSLNRQTPDQAYEGRVMWPVAG